MEEALRLESNNYQLVSRYVHTLIREDLSPGVNSVEIAEEYLRQKYDLELDLSAVNIKVQCINMLDLRWLTNLTLNNLRVFQVIRSPLIFKNYKFPVFTALNLKSLDLCNNKIISLDSLSTLNGFNVPRLEYLDLSYNPIMEFEGLRLDTLKNLHYLGLSSINISDICALSNIDLKYIKHLDLSFNPISSIEGFDLSKNNITTVNLYGTSIYDSMRGTGSKLSNPFSFLYNTNQPFSFLYNTNQQGIL